MSKDKTRSLSTKQHRLLKNKYDRTVKVLMEVTRYLTQHLKESPPAGQSNNLLAEIMKLDGIMARNIKKAKVILKENNIKI
jgi:hypothetical protein